MGLDVRSPVLLAAGFDKHAEMYNALGALGFGGVEVGTLTAHAQPGNERPRLFRLIEDRALINRMGFNNCGAEAGARAIARHPPSEGLVLGINLGKSKVTPVEQAPDDYARSAALLGTLANYLVVNVSSPNTPGLRALQSIDALGPIVAAVRRALESVGASPPLLVKLAPDLADEDIDALADFAVREGLSGLIATNTTVSREGLRTASERVAAMGAGGLSGPPLRARALTVLRRLRARVGARVTLVAAGGIETADHAWEAARAGATLLQLYTGFIYQGPSIAMDITRGLCERMRREGFQRWADVVGSESSTPGPLSEQGAPQGPREIAGERDSADPDARGREPADRPQQT
jgi:dihydroorotate dehydrogenase